MSVALSDGKKFSPNWIKEHDMFSIAGEWLPLPGIRCRGQGLCRKRRFQPPLL